MDMAVIKNYGLRWVRDRVDWGGRGRRGSLTGIPRSARTSAPVDFCEQIGVYVLYEAGFSPIYVGQAGFENATLFSRLRAHRNDHLRDRWTHFTWFGFREVNANGNLRANQDSQARTSLSYARALDELEGILIQVLEPRLNRQGAAWQRDAIEFIQEGRPAEADAIEEIREAMERIEQTVRQALGKPKQKRGG